MLARRWLPFLLLASMVSGITAFVIADRRPPEYKATATLLIGLADQLPNRSEAMSAGQALARTYARTFDDSRIYAQAVQDLGLDGVSQGELQSNVKVFAVRDTQLVEVDVTWPAPDQAVRIANYLAQAFAERRRQEALEELEPTQQYIANRRAEIAQQLHNVRRSDYDAPETLILRSDLDQLIGREQALTLQSFDLRKQINVVSPASTAEQAGLPTSYIVLIAILVAAAVAAALAIIVEMFSPTQLPEDMAQQLGFQSFIALPALHQHTVRAWRTLIDYSNSTTAQVLRLLAGRLPASARYMMTGGIGKRTDSATVAVNLAAASAESGRRVLLVDANLNAPRLNALFEMAGSDGLNQVIYQGQSLESALLATPLPGVTLLGAGPVPPQTDKVDDPGQISSLIESLQDRFDLIIVDLHEPLQHRSASALVNLTEALILVVHQREATDTAMRPYSSWAQLKQFVVAPTLIVYNGIAPVEPSTPTSGHTLTLAQQA